MFPFAGRSSTYRRHRRLSYMMSAVPPWNTLVTSCALCVINPSGSKFRFAFFRMWSLRHPVLRQANLALVHVVSQTRANGYSELIDILRVQCNFIECGTRKRGWSGTYLHPLLQPHRCLFLVRQRTQNKSLLHSRRLNAKASEVALNVQERRG